MCSGELAGFVAHDPLLQVGLERVLTLTRNLAVALQEQGYDPFDPYLGLVLAKKDISLLLQTLLSLPESVPISPDIQELDKRLMYILQEGDVSPPLSHVVGRFGLSLFEMDVLLLALLPEISPLHGKVISFLNNDVTKSRPSVFLAVRLLAAADRADRPRQVFAATAPLMHHTLIRWHKEEETLPLFQRGYFLDEGIVNYLLAGSDADCRVVRRVDDARLRVVTDLLPATAAALEHVAFRLLERQLTAVMLASDDPARSDQAVAYLVRKMGMPLLVAQPNGDILFRRLARLALRDAMLRKSILLWKTCEKLGAEDWQSLVEMASSYGVPLLIAGDCGPVLPESVLRLTIQGPNLASRRAIWTAALEVVPHVDLEIESVANRFRLNAQQIQSAVQAAMRLAWLDGRERIARKDIEAAVRRVSSPALGTLAHKLTPRYSWDDIVLPDDVKEQLREFGAAIRHREMVYDAWGFETRSEGRGINALFAGVSGTGKTMAAEILARESGMDIFKIDLSAVVSKYVGETEKQLRRIFKEASRGNVILFFDEADALFGKRSEVRDAHDRYANIEVAYLLQALEEHTGVVIMATNLFGNLDSAFVRRMHFVVQFPFPDAAMRQRIWQVVFPRAAPLAADVDFADLGKRLQITGGHIRNIALSAAFLAAADGRVITQKHIRHAGRRELQKMGKLVEGGGT